MRLAFDGVLYGSGTVQHNYAEIGNDKTSSLHDGSNIYFVK